MASTDPAPGAGPPHRRRSPAPPTTARPSRLGRIGWQVLRLLGPLAGILLAVALATVVGRWLPLPPSVADLLIAVAALAAYLGLVRLIEQRPVEELSLHHAPRRLGIGALLGFALISLTVGVLAVLGVFHLEGSGSGWAPPAAALGAGVAAGVVEELMFRGVLLRVLDGWVGSTAAVVVSALVFGLLHLNNPGATALGGAVVCVAGLLLGASYLVTRSLWMPIALHATWNFTEDGIWGTPVSGFSSQGVFAGHLEGPSWLTGGEFGLEGSVVTLVVATTLTAIVIRQARRRGRWAPRPRPTPPSRTTVDTPR